MATKITNHYQVMVVNELAATIAKLKAAVDAEPTPDHTKTFIAYYDTIVNKEDLNDLVEVCMDNITKSMVQHNLNNLRDINQREDQREQDNIKKKNPMQQEIVEAQAKYRRRLSTLLQYMPQKSHKSSILSDL